MAEITTSVNWLAVGVGAFLSYLLGWLWYSPKFFGTKWAEGVGVSLAGSAEMPIAAMAFQALATFFLAWTVGITAVNNALFTMILIVVTILLLMTAAGLFAKKSTYAITVEMGFVVAMTVIMVVCQGLL
ncbi:MAG: DUF1761 domain-containing protein [Alphaproteobacteria bacterium]|nr:DUF1761 domain-containing protein [Alphaproteobacteria bacterium]